MSWTWTKGLACCVCDVYFSSRQGVWRLLVVIRQLNGTTWVTLLVISFPHRFITTRGRITSNQETHPQANLINHTRHLANPPPAIHPHYYRRIYHPVCKPKVKNTPSPRSP